MDATQTYECYLADLAYLLREDAADARDERTKGGDAADYHRGRESAFVEVLMRMQSQADAFELQRDKIGLDGFEPLGGDLRPRPGRIA